MLKRERKVADLESAVPPILSLTGGVSTQKREQEMFSDGASRPDIVRGCALPTVSRLVTTDSSDLLVMDQWWCTGVQQVGS